VFQTVKNINQTVRQRSPIPGSNANINNANNTGMGGVAVAAAGLAGPSAGDPDGVGDEQPLTPILLPRSSWCFPPKR
jgi:hypothetical protein